MNDGSQRREYERRRWPDERIDDLAELVRAFGPTVSMAVTSAADIEALERDVSEIKASVGQLDDRVRSSMSQMERRLCERMDRDARAWGEFRREYRENREKDVQAREQEAQRREQDQAQAKATRTGGRWALWAAIASGAALVLASLITALVALLGGAPG